MKRKILGIFLITGLLFAGCVKDDIDDLQKQIDDLEGQVAKNTEAIQKDLLNQIASLEAELDALSNKTDQDNQNLTAMIADLQADLDTISNDVENNAKTVYYGNLVTADRPQR
jgi:outer membrane murein-binding lipoprotein Lpp